MKKQVLVIALGLMTYGAFAQKDEIKAAEKAIKKQDFASALSAISALDAIENSMDAKYKANYYFLKGQALLGKNNLEEAATSFNKLFAYENEIGKIKYTKEAQPMLNSVIQKVSENAIKQYNEDKDFAAAAKNFYLTYKLSPTDTTFLYNAAVSASQAEDYDLSLQYFKEAKDVGYTGVTTQYVATNKEGQVVNLGTKSQRDLYVKTGEYTNPEDVITESKRADIIKNIGYIYVNQGKPELAIAALEEARQANPKDINLILNQAQMYVKLEKMDEFSRLMKEAVELDPNNATLLFNLGVVNANENKNEEAISYYKKAIEIDPNYADAYMNLAITILSGEKSIVEEMNNNLSNFKKYDELQAKQKDLYKNALPFLEKADSLKRSEGVVRTLLNIYDTLEMTEEADALRPVYNELRSGN